MLYRIEFDDNQNHEHAIFTGTLSVNQHGDYGYLGGR
jgi:hypothetical protein